MPISSRRFETLDEGGVTPETNAEQIVAFLLENQDQAYRMTEIEEQTGIKRGSIAPTLSRLKEQGIVDHRAKYWRISENYQASQAAAVYTSEAVVEYDDGKEFDESAWAAEAEDEDAHEDVRR